MVEEHPFRLPFEPRLALLSHPQKVSFLSWVQREEPARLDRVEAHRQSRSHHRLETVCSFETGYPDMSMSVVVDVFH